MVTNGLLMFSVDKPDDLDAARVALCGDGYGSKKQFSILLGFPDSRALAAMRRRGKVSEQVKGHVQTLMLLNPYQLQEKKAAVSE